MNITYEDIRRTAETNGTSVDQAFETIARTAERDRVDHPKEYGAADSGRVAG